MRAMLLVAGGSMCAMLAQAPVGHAQTAAVANLQRAMLCSIETTKGSVSREGNYPSNWTIKMDNDGGWCWRGVQSRFGSQTYAPTFRITSPPAHGNLQIGEVTEDRTRIAYKPAPGFIGADTFTLTESTRGWQIIATITIAQ
jgi:hypothetical protein